LQYLGKQVNYQPKMVKSDFFQTLYDGKNGRKGLRHTFLRQPNTFCFMNLAVKLSAELRSVPVFSRYGKLSDKNIQNLIFLGHPMTLKMVGNNVSIHS
jgi:hypothetical protein